MPLRVLGVITARGGSKGIPRKNIQPLAGRPLIAYTIEAAKGSTLLTRCIVSTDDPDIADLSRSLGADVPFLRPPELATDQSLALDVLCQSISALEARGETYDAVMMLQPTSPLRTGKDIDACIRLMEETDADSVMSMAAITDFSPKKLKRIDNGRILPLLEPEGSQSAPRHQGPDVYKRNCAVYLTKTELLKKGEQFGERSMAYIMPRERSVDINDPVDVEIAEFWLHRLNTHDA